MKKVYLLTIVLVLPFFSVLSQNIPKAEFHHTLIKEKKAKAQVPMSNKAYGDTLHYEDFSSGSINTLPQGWSTYTNPSVQGWRWSTTAPGGQYTTVGPLNSTSSANGFMSLPLDSMNTPTPTGGFTNIVSEMTSSAIVIQPKSSVLLSFETALRYCCNQLSVDINLQVSTDSINWDTYDASDGVNPSTSLTNATKVNINITQTLALADTLYLRFKMSGASHFYWMIDDVVIYEGYEHEFIFEDYSVNFTNNFTVNPVYTIIPQQAMYPLSFDGATINLGGNIQTNAYIELEVFNDSTWLGGIGRGLVYRDSTFIADTVELAQRDTGSVGPYFNIDNGYFRAKLSALSDSPNYAPLSRIEYRFNVSDTVLAKDRNVFLGDIGVGSYVGGGSQGDLMLTVVSIGGTDSVLATSLSFYVGNNAANDGVQISPVIYQFGGALPSPINLMAQNSNPTTIDTTMFGSWITIDFASGGGTGNVWLQGGQQYAIGWRQENGGNGEEFSVGRAFSMERYQPDLSNFIFVASSSTPWGWVTAQPAIRLNLGNLIIVGEEELESQEKEYSFSVFPNPTNGEFTLTAESNSAKSYHLIVRNMLGQTVHSELIAVNGQVTKNMNLNSLEKGVYFVSLENEEEKLVKKVVLK